MNKINFAILGLGHIATKMATAISSITDKLNLYAVGSRSIDKANDFKNKYGFLKAYGSYEELVKDNNIDLIYIATPHSEHYKNTLLCLENNKNCLVEKAFCSNYKEAKELVRLAKSKNLFLAEAMWTRYQPGINRIKEVLKNIGEISFLEADFSMDLENVERLKNPNLSGGTLLDLGIYPLTIADIFFGSNIESIKLNINKYSTGVDATDNITFIYEDKKMAKLKASFVSDKSNYAKIIGTNGYIEFAPINAPEYIKLYDNNNKLLIEEKINFIKNGYEYEVIECIEAIKNNNLETKSMPLSKTLQIMKWMDSIRNKANIIYPFETKDDINLSDAFVWSKNNVYEE